MYALIITTPRPDELEQTLPHGLDFTRAYQDELQTLVRDARTALDVALAAVRAPGVVVGLGIAAPAAGAEDSALGYARAAVEHCSPVRQGPIKNIAADAADPADADALTALLRLLSRGINQRTDAEWRVLDLLVPGVRGQHQAIAGALGITPQAVSKALIRTGWHEESEGRAAAVHALERLGSPSA